MTVEIETGSEAETRALGRRLAGLVRSGDVVLLGGGLGAGKTALAAGLAQGLGVQQRVTSPSFVLVQRYDGGFLPVIHADVYRLASRSEVDDLDLLEEAREGVLVVEWGQAVGEIMPGDHLMVEMEITGPETRLIRLDPRGSWEDRLLQELVAPPARGEKE